MWMAGGNSSRNTSEYQIIVKKQFAVSLNLEIADRLSCHFCKALHVKYVNVSLVC